MTDIIQELRGLLADERKALRDMKESGAPNDALLDAWLKASGRLHRASDPHLPALLDRLEAAERGWQPIETAPRDGTTIDVWRDGTRETVYWGLPPHCCGEMGQYCDSDWHSIKKPGWICSTFGEFVGGKHDPFTHWRPLPDAPAIREVKP